MGVPALGQAEARWPSRDGRKREEKKGPRADDDALTIFFPRAGAAASRARGWRGEGFKRREREGVVEEGMFRERRKKGGEEGEATSSANHSSAINQGKESCVRHTDDEGRCRGRGV